MAIINSQDSNILNLIEDISRDDDISKEEVIKSLEKAVALAAKYKYGATKRIRANLNRKTGEIAIYQEIYTPKEENEEDSNDGIDSEVSQQDETSVVQEPIERMHDDEASQRYREGRGHASAVSDVSNRYRDQGRPDEKYGPRSGDRGGYDNYSKTYEDASESESEEARADRARIYEESITLRKLPDLDTNNQLQATKVKEFFLHEINNIKKNRQYQEYINKIDDLFSATVKQINQNSRGEMEIIIALNNKADAILRKGQIIPKERFSVDDKILVHLLAVEKGIRSNKLVFTRNSRYFVIKLLEQQVPEMRSKAISVLAIARVPGSKTKLVAKSNDIRLDPIQCMVGPRGSRIKNVTSELKGEKIYVAKWSSDTRECITNILSPIKPVTISISNTRIEIVVQDEEEGAAYGSGRINLKLICELFPDKKITIISETGAAAAKEQIEKNRIILTEALEIDDITSKILVMNEYSDLSDIANASVVDLGNIDGISRDLASDMIVSAKYAIIIEVMENFGLSQKLFDVLSSLEVDELFKCTELAKQGILTLEDFAALSAEKFRQIVYTSELTDEAIYSLIDAASNAIGSVVTESESQEKEA